MQRLAGKVAVVTGSTQGLGEGIAMRLAREGAAIVVNGRSLERGQRVLERLTALGARAIFLPADLSDRQAAEGLIEEAAARLGGVDILVNNAQALAPAVETLDPANDAWFDLVLRSGLYASLATARAAFPFMRARGGGRIINFGSINAVFGSRYGAAYNATKEAIRGLTRTLANELGEHGITVNAIMPSGLSPAYEAFFKDDPARAEASAKSIPMRRHGRPEEDIGAAVLGLVSESGRFITGETLFVDGGQFLSGLPQLHGLAEQGS
jgi:NAD(P)-dependent dehydrogenase (short-subunit alcohol dehydrogenase family)